MIYLARIADGPIKIGYSSNVHRRMAELAGLYGCKVELLGILEGDRSRESSLHREFSRFRLGGSEQFLPVAELFRLVGLDAPEEEPDMDMDPVLFRDGKVSFITPIRASLHRQMKMAALSEGKTLGGWLTDFLEDHLFGVKPDSKTKTLPNR